jgi:hypothetical protein
MITFGTPMDRGSLDQRSLVQALLSDGRPLLIFTGLSLMLSGCFALFLAASGHFLPHDIQFLGISTEQLCIISGCRVVHFMLHDRVAFGGSLVAIGALYIVVGRVSPPPAGDVVMVVIRYHRLCRIRQFSHISWIWLSGHVARNRHIVSAPLFHSRVNAELLLSQGTKKYPYAI